MHVWYKLLEAHFFIIKKAHWKKTEAKYFSVRDRITRSLSVDVLMNNLMIYLPINVTLCWVIKPGLNHLNSLGFAFDAMENTTFFIIFTGSPIRHYHTHIHLIRLFFVLLYMHVCKIRTTSAGNFYNLFKRVLLSMGFEVLIRFALIYHCESHSL